MKENKTKKKEQTKINLKFHHSPPKKKKIQENSRSKTNGGTFALSLIALKT